MANESSCTEQRKTDRVSFSTDVSVTLGGQVIEGLLLDISAGGAKVRLMTPPSGEDNFVTEGAVLNIPRFGKFDGKIVWRDGKFAGIQFSENHKTLVNLIREAVAQISAA